MKTPTNWEDNQLSREGSRQQQIKARRQMDIDTTIHHYLTMLEVALAEDFNLQTEEIRALVQVYYQRIPPKL